MFDDQSDDQRLTIGVMAAQGYFDPTPIPTEILAARGDRLVRIHTLLFNDIDATFEDPDDFDDAAVDLISDILHALYSDERRDLTLRRAQDRFADERDSWLVYDHNRPGDHHGPTGPWSDCPACTAATDAR